MKKLIKMSKRVKTVKKAHIFSNIIKFWQVVSRQNLTRLSPLSLAYIHHQHRSDTVKMKLQHLQFYVTCSC